MYGYASRFGIFIYLRETGAVHFRDDHQLFLALSEYCAHCNGCLDAHLALGIRNMNALDVLDHIAGQIDIHPVCKATAKSISHQ